MGTFWINGNIVDANQATVSVLDHGFTVGDGIFETLKVVDGQPFALTRHLSRLQKSALGLGLQNLELEFIKNGVSQILEANPNSGRLRITVTSGAGPLGSGRGKHQCTVVLAVSDAPSWGPDCGIVILPWRRNEHSCLTGIKSTSYAENAISLDVAHSFGMTEAIYFDTQLRLSEGTGTNIFIVKEDQVATPSIDCGILQGVTRNLVIEWAQMSGTIIVERHVTAAELEQADEIFLTSTTRDVQPVTCVKWLSSRTELDREQILDVGQVSINLSNLFQSNARKNIDP